eukprot:5995423-Alexandrium_andersonii.AAC.1
MRMGLHVQQPGCSQPTPLLGAGAEAPDTQAGGAARQHAPTDPQTALLVDSTVSFWWWCLEPNAKLDHSTRQITFPKMIKRM